MNCENALNFYAKLNPSCLLRISLSLEYTLTLIRLFHTHSYSQTLYNDQLRLTTTNTTGLISIT